MNDLITDPNFLAYRFDLNTETVGFLPITRDEIRRVSCLKREYLDPDRQLVEVPLADLVDLASSRCLDVEGTTVNLREPQILLDAANAKRLEWRSKSTDLNYSYLPALALALLQKHAGPSEKLIIKPINSVNNIIPELLQLTGNSKSLMLYTDVRNFVLSTLKKGEGGKQTIRSMFDLIRCDFPHLANLQLTHTIHMTDLRIAMTVWRLQLDQAERAIRHYSKDKVIASLYGESLIDHPLEALQAANEFLELGISSDQIRSIVNSDDRFADAKNEGEQFSKQKRAEEYEQLEAFFGADLDDGLQWMLRTNSGTRLIPELSVPLLPR